MVVLSASSSRGLGDRTDRRLGLRWGSHPGPAAGHQSRRSLFGSAPGGSAPDRGHGRCRPFDGGHRTGGFGDRTADRFHRSVRLRGGPWHSSRVTLFATELLSNAVVAVLITPVAVALADSFGVDPRPFLIEVMIAASAAFATPFGCQTILLVFQVGKYKYMDFVRVGVPLNLVTWSPGHLVTWSPGQPASWRSRSSSRSDPKRASFHPCPKDQ